MLVEDVKVERRKREEERLQHLQKVIGYILYDLYGYDGKEREIESGKEKENNEEIEGPIVNAMRDVKGK